MTKKKTTTTKKTSTTKTPKADPKPKSPAIPTFHVARENFSGYNRALNEASRLASLPARKLEDGKHTAKNWVFQVKQ